MSLPTFTPTMALYLDGCVAARSQFVGDLIRLDEYRCLHDGDGLQSERSRPYPTMIFSFAGSSVCRFGAHRLLLDPTRVTLHPAELPYSTSHPWGCACRGVVVSLCASAADELVGQGGRWLTRPEARMLSPSHQLRLRALLTRLPAKSQFEALGAEEELLLLMGEILSSTGSAPPRRGTRAATARQHERCVEATCGLLNEQYREPLSLAEIARRVYSSPAHLSRLFRRTTGVPVHRYRTRLRLLAALDELSDPATDLSRMALDLGFSSHSHLTSTFRQEFGKPPATLRRELGNTRSSPREPAWRDHS